MTSIYFDRRANSDLVDVLAPGGPLHGLAKIAADPTSPVDLRLPRPAGRRGQSSRLLREPTKVLDVEHHPTKGFRFKPTPGQNVPSAFQPAGELALC
jgi:hypothetical protein